MNAAGNSVRMSPGAPHQRLEEGWIRVVVCKPLPAPQHLLPSRPRLVDVGARCICSGCIVERRPVRCSALCGSRRYVQPFIIISRTVGSTFASFRHSKWPQDRDHCMQPFDAIIIPLNCKSCSTASLNVRPSLSQLPRMVGDLVCRVDARAARCALCAPPCAEDTHPP